MPVIRFGRQGKRPYGFCAKVTVAVVLGLCFFVIWSTISSPSALVSSQRSSFGGISSPVSEEKGVDAKRVSKKKESRHGVTPPQKKEAVTRENDGGKVKEEAKDWKNVDSIKKQGRASTNVTHNSDGSLVEDPDKAKEGEDGQEEEEEEAIEGERDQDSNIDFNKDGDGIEESAGEGDENGNLNKAENKKKKHLGPLFDPKAHYTWKLCSTRTGHNYVPCIDIEGASWKLHRYQHQERSCPKIPPMCLVPLPEGYGPHVHWPESKSKILYKNVAHPKLSAFIKTQSWSVLSRDYLTFPQNQSGIKGGAVHYVDSIEEMVPDIEWGKNIRLVLDIGCTDASFSAALLKKDVLTLSLGLKDDVKLAHIALERGFPTIIGIMATQRLPFPGGVFDAIHCGGCAIPWHLHGGKFLLEVNRILRPGGYFILSREHDNIEVEEAMSKLTASICWNILAHRTDEISEVGVKIYQKPSSNDIYALRRKKVPPLCKEDDNPNSAWYTLMRTCLHPVPAAIEERGTEWPEEWPGRLNTFPDWLSNSGNLAADTEHWKAIISNSYLNGMGINWSNVRNILDMKAIYGGFAAALEPHQIWVMNVVPIHSPDTLPVIYERGLVGTYHDWCEPFSTYPRSYDLLHADHLFSRIKNRCKQPVGIVVEMDRILRPEGWAIIRDKVEILSPLEEILKELHWEIRMTYSKDKEGIICAQKTTWRP